MLLNQNKLVKKVLMDKGALRKIIQARHSLNKPLYVTLKDGTEVRIINVVPVRR